MTIRHNVIPETKQETSDIIRLMCDNAYIEFLDGLSDNKSKLCTQNYMRSQGCGSWAMSGSMYLVASNAGRPAVTGSSCMQLELCASAVWSPLSQNNLWPLYHVTLYCHCFGSRSTLQQLNAMSRWIFAGALLLALSVLSAEAQTPATSTSTSGTVALISVVSMRYMCRHSFTAVAAVSPNKRSSYEANVSPV